MVDFTQDRLGFKFEWEIQNRQEFAKQLLNLANNVDDMRIPFGLIAKDWFKSNRQLFTLKGAGLYEDLSTKPFRAFWPNTRDYGALYEGGYKQYKQENFGFTYPILVGKTQRLKRSLTDPTSSWSHLFVGRQKLTMGTTVDYAKYHQSDDTRTKIPQRKLVFISGGPADKSRDSAIGNRIQRWTAIIAKYIERQGNKKG